MRLYIISKICLQYFPFSLKFTIIYENCYWRLDGGSFPPMSHNHIEWISPLLVLVMMYWVFSLSAYMPYSFEIFIFFSCYRTFSWYIFPLSFVWSFPLYFHFRAVRKSHWHTHSADIYRGTLVDIFFLLSF